MIVQIEFKRGVYEMALTELARFLPRPDHRNRYLRGGMRQRDGGDMQPIRTQERHGGGPRFALPPGASLDTPPGAMPAGRTKNG